MSFSNLRGARPALAAAAAAAAFFASAPVQAAEEIFTETYLAETLPEGGKELEQWVTFRDKKSEGSYHNWQYRTEFEYGITDRWMASLYANFYSVRAHSDNSIASRNDYTIIGDGDEVSGGGPVTFGNYVPGSSRLPIPSARYGDSGFESVSVETIYQLLSPYKDDFGLAGYAEYSYGDHTRELELKMLFQKNLMEDDLVLAGNVVVEFERDEFSRIIGEKETELLLTGGASYRFAPGWRAGVELINQRGYEGGYSLSSGNKDYSAWFLGPTIHYADERFYVTLGYQQQMPWASAYSQSAKDELVNDRVYKETEKHNFRMKIGYSF